MLLIDDLTPGDTAPARAVFAGLSPRSRWLRYQAAHHDLPALMLRSLAAVEPGRHVVHVARDDGVPVGMVRWIRDPVVADLAEVAVEVVDRHQGRGVGRTLLRAAARSACAAGVTTFWAHLGEGTRGLRSRIAGLAGEVEVDGTEVRFRTCALAAGVGVQR